MATSQQQAPGGRESVRRFLVAIILMVAGAIPLAQGKAGDDPRPLPTVTVRQDRGVYLVTARFQVPQAPALALAVLTDYEQIPQFMPGVETSIVLERGDGRVVVEQEAVSHLLMFSKRVHLVLEITEGADTLLFRDRSGRSFARYDGAWRWCGENGGTDIRYDLTAQPSFDVPEFMLKRLLRRNAAEMIEGLRKEMAARSAR